MPLCQVPIQRHSAKTHFAECQKIALVKMPLCRVPKNGTRQNTSLPSAEKKHSAKSSLSSVFFFCRVYFIWHSTKPPALGKVPVSSSVSSLPVYQVITSMVSWIVCAPYSLLLVLALTQIFLTILRPRQSKV